MEDNDKARWAGDFEGMEGEGECLGLCGGKHEWGRCTDDVVMVFNGDRKLGGGAFVARDGDTDAGRGDAFSNDAGSGEGESGFISA